MRGHRIRSMVPRWLPDAARAFARDESGQAITEYILLLSLTLVSAIAIARGMLSMINTATLTLGGQLEKDLKTGRVALGLWSN